VQQVLRQHQPQERQRGLLRRQLEQVPLLGQQVQPLRREQERVQVLLLFCHRR